MEYCLTSEGIRLQESPEAFLIVGEPWMSGAIRPEREHSRPLAAAGRTAPSVDGALASSAFSRCVRRKTRAAHDKTTNMCARLAVSNDIVTSACAFPLETQ